MRCARRRCERQQAAHRLRDAAPARATRAACRSSRTRRSRRRPRSRGRACDAVRRRASAPRRRVDDSHAAPAPSAISVFMSGLLCRTATPAAPQVVPARHEHDDRAEHELERSTLGSAEVDAVRHRDREQRHRQRDRDQASRFSVRASACVGRARSHRAAPAAPRPAPRRGRRREPRSPRRGSPPRPRAARGARSTTIRARDSGRLTSALATPGTAATARSTRRTHAAQVMPSTGRSIVVASFAHGATVVDVITTLRITGMTCNGLCPACRQGAAGVSGVRGGRGRACPIRRRSVDRDRRFCIGARAGRRQ